MKLKIKLFIIASISMAICIIAHHYIARKNHSLYQLTVIELASGTYGYTITRNEQMVIYQPFVPGLPSQQPFTSTTDARRVGSLVKKRLERNKNYSITKEDLNKLQLSGYP